MEVNFFGVIRLTNLVLSHMIEDKDKREYSIVNVGSVQSYLGNILAKSLFKTIYNIIHYFN